MLLVVAGASVFLEIRGMQVDSHRLVEETRESVLSGDLLFLIHRIKGEVETSKGELGKGGALWGKLKPLWGRLEELLKKVMKGSGERDPSRRQHQEAEERLVGRILKDLASCRSMLFQPHPPKKSILKRLSLAKRYSKVLTQEMRGEFRRANEDLHKRTAGTSWLLWLSFLLVAVGFLFLSLFFVRHIIMPIEELRDGAERFGRGELGFRIPGKRRDELGDLASSFNEMASKIAATHEVLERNLERRTQEFIQASRFADLGVLAAGLAHEINNPLASIASSADGLDRRLGRGELDSEEAGVYLKTIANEAYRAKGITERLLALARPREEKMGQVDLRLVLSHLEIMFRHQVEDRGLILRVDCDEEIPWVRGNPGAYMQVFSNLLRNAMDASPTGGLICVTCLQDAKGLRVEVLDQGEGLGEKERQMIFEPFYTTKDPGKGTGLGLSLVSSLLASMGGRIEVENRREGGCCFSVFFSVEAVGS